MPRATQFKNFMVAPRTLTAATTLTEVDSGKTIFLNSTTEFEVTLPKVKAGLNFTFIVKAAPSGASYTIVADSQNLMFGQIYTSDVNSEYDADSNIYAASTLTFADSISVVGDRAELISDGTYWYVKAFTRTYNAITLTISPSASPSTSVSISPSASSSVSLSISPSVSKSVSPSVSPSISKSVSPSVSLSVSPSVSLSASPSISPSAS
jgi:hypothetical protein